uniref:Uncharacterized protein n=1 Tax=Glossina palpalis gambiensis TaxID=67801 RepID=A0A1B0C2G1_9MUSC
MRESVLVEKKIDALVIITGRGIDKITGKKSGGPDMLTDEKFDVQIDTYLDIGLGTFEPYFYKSSNIQTKKRSGIENRAASTIACSIVSLKVELSGHFLKHKSNDEKTCVNALSLKLFHSMSPRCAMASPNTLELANMLGKLLTETNISVISLASRDKSNRVLMKFPRSIIRRSVYSDMRQLFLFLFAAINSSVNQFVYLIKS